jgi:hypothetical protein
VKVRPVMWRSRLGKHSDDDSVEPRNLRHGLSSLARRLPSSRRPSSLTPNKVHSGESRRGMVTDRRISPAGESWSN